MAKPCYQIGNNSFGITISKKYACIFLIAVILFALIFLSFIANPQYSAYNKFVYHWQNYVFGKSALGPPDLIKMKYTGIYTHWNPNGDIISSNFYVSGKPITFLSAGNQHEFIVYNLMSNDSDRGYRERSTRNYYSSEDGKFKKMAWLMKDFSKTKRGEQMPILVIDENGKILNGEVKIDLSSTKVIIDQSDATDRIDINYHNEP